MCACMYIHIYIYIIQYAIIYIYIYRRLLSGALPQRRSLYTSQVSRAGHGFTLFCAVFAE